MKPAFAPNYSTAVKWYARSDQSVQAWLPCDSRVLDNKYQVCSMLRLDICSTTNLWGNTPEVVTTVHRPVMAWYPWRIHTWLQQYTLDTKHQFGVNLRLLLVFQGPGHFSYIRLLIDRRCCNVFVLFAICHFCRISGKDSPWRSAKLKFHTPCRQQPAAAISCCSSTDKKVANQDTCIVCTSLTPSTQPAPSRVSPRCNWIQCIPARQNVPHCNTSVGMRIVTDAFKW